MDLFLKFSFTIDLKSFLTGTDFKHPDIVTRQFVISSTQTGSRWQTKITASKGFKCIAYCFVKGSYVEPPLLPLKTGCRTVMGVIEENHIFFHENSHASPCPPGTEMTIYISGISKPDVKEEDDATEEPSEESSVEPLSSADDATSQKEVAKKTEKKKKRKKDTSDDAGASQTTERATAATRKRFTRSSLDH